MKTLRVAARARADLAFIADYTREAWGEAQAEKYLAEIEDGFRLLLTIPEAGRRCEDIREGCRSLAKAHHVIYYEINGDFVDILGVLHERMDPAAQFDDAS